MTSIVTATVNESLGALNIRGDEKKVEPTEYKYTHLVPAFPKDEHYPPLTPFEHVDPGHRALSHPNPRSFLDGAKVIQLTPPIGEEVRGVNLATLTDDEKDQLALEVRKISTVLLCPILTSSRLQRAKWSYSGTSKTLSIGIRSSTSSGVSLSHSPVKNNRLTFPRSVLRPTAHPPHIRSSRGLPTLAPRLPQRDIFVQL